MTNELAKKQCIPCKGGVPPLKGENLKNIHKQLNSNWMVVDEHHLEMEYYIQQFSSSACFHKPSRRARRSRRTPSGYLPGLGYSKTDGLDTQNRWPNGKRLYLCCQSRRVVINAYHVCQVCGYVTDKIIPAKCPICGAPKEKFRTIEG